MEALEFLKEFPDNYADLILTDPPYGINAGKGTTIPIEGIAGQKYSDEWDNETPKKEIFDEGYLAIFMKDNSNINNILS